MQNNMNDTMKKTNKTFFNYLFHNFDKRELQPVTTLLLTIRNNNVSGSPIANLGRCLNQL